MNNKITLPMRLLRAFSLVELMISLIAISLITAAMAPVITKKLSAGTITVGSFGGSGGGIIPASCNITNCYECGADGKCKKCYEDLGYSLQENGYCMKTEEQQDDDGDDGVPSKEKCEALGALFIPASKNGENGKNLCVSKINPPDLEIINTSYFQVAVVPADSTSTSSMVCWKGFTAYSSDHCSSLANGSYSGCTRTVCNWEAANEICKNWAPGNSRKGSWRLPTLEELEGWKTEINSSDSLVKYQKEDGLMLCDNISGKTGGYMGADTCHNSYSSYNRCDGASSCTPGAIWSNIKASAYLLSSGTFSNTAISANNGASFRCVTQNYKQPLISFPKNQLTIEGEPASQADCDKFNSIFIPAKHNGNTKNICVTKFNLLDMTNMDTSYLGIAVVPADSTSTSSMVCWRGFTAYSSDHCSTGGVNGYTGCNRTMCNWYAANELCKNWAPEGSVKGAWRLPKEEEVAAWIPYLDSDTAYSTTYSNYKKAYGLMFCDNISGKTGGYMGADTCHNSYNSYNRCDGASSCQPASVWTSNGGGSLYSTLRLEGRKYQIYNLDPTLGASVRCVSDNLLK